MKSLQLQPAAASLPVNGVGGEAFMLMGASGMLQNNILVPYADESQTGGDITTWINKATH